MRLILATFFLGCAAPLAAQQTLTLQQAVDVAQRNNPQVTAAKLISLAQGQVTRETRAGELPTISGSLTAVKANDGSRLTAGSLNNPVLYTRAGAGVSASQLITDFGRTQELVRSARLRAEAEEQNARATAAQIQLAVEDTFFSALAAQQVEKVAQQTVSTRQAIADRISALTSARLKSTLDQSLAEVSLQQAKLLELNARSQFRERLNALNALMGNESAVSFTLVDQRADAPALPPTDAEPLVMQALQARPEVQSATAASGAAREFSRAEGKLMLPTISALGAAGTTPVRTDQITTSWYGAVGGSVSIPIFNGLLNSSRAKEAELRARAAEQNLARVRQIIARDVRQAVLEAQDSYQRVGVSTQLSDQANQALDLAETRYRLGLSSIVELSQAQLAATEASIEAANARFQYQRSLAVLHFAAGY